MPTLYPEIEPTEHGMLAVGDGHHLYWEQCGNPKGKAAVILHGGPGSGCSPRMRRYFNPAVYRIVLFDQRNCGRSTPPASDITTDLSTNTTTALIADIERLRQHLGIERWLVFGGSWGCTLALAYAQRYLQRVSEMVLMGITTTRRSEIDWLYHGVSPLFPEQYARFRAGVPEAERAGDLVAAYYRLLQNPDPAVHRQAAHDWCTWEASLVSTDPDYVPAPYWSDPDFQLTFARIVTHYFHHNAWLEDGILLRNAAALAGIPGILIHGRLDLDAPLVTAWELAQAWPESELILVRGAGHASSDPGMSEALIAATDRFAAHT
jgi:proline iminopeptidase